MPKDRRNIRRFVEDRAGTRAARPAACGCCLGAHVRTRAPLAPGIGVALAAGVGAAFGAAFDASIALSVAIGAAVGFVIGAVVWNMTARR